MNREMSVLSVFNINFIPVLSAVGSDSASEVLHSGVTEEGGGRFVLKIINCCEEKVKYIRSIYSILYTSCRLHNSFVSYALHV